MSDIKNFERNKYFYGKLMTVRDFETEQRYFIEKQRLINRLIHGEGVVCGLKVEEAGDTKIRINPGVAIDCCGRDIIVPEEKVVDLREGYSLDGIDKVYVLLKYDICEKESVPVIANASACEETCCYNRILETYKIEISDKMPVDCPPDDSGLCEAWSNTQNAEPVGEGGGLCAVGSEEENAEKFVEYWIKECPECPEEPAVVLAAISLQNSTIEEIDNAIVNAAGVFKKSLVFSNPRLYELIKCLKPGLEDDLTVIEEITPGCGDEISLESFLIDGITIDFSNIIEGISFVDFESTFQVAVFAPSKHNFSPMPATTTTPSPTIPATDELDTAYLTHHYEYIPYSIGISSIYYHGVTHEMQVTLKPKEQTRHFIAPLINLEPSKKLKILVRIKCDFIEDMNGKAVAGHHLLGIGKSGLNIDGKYNIQGGIFESWFTVERCPVFITKRVSSTICEPGNELTYTITYSNTNSVDLTKVMLTDTIPTTTKLVPGTISNGGIVEGGNITWDIGKLEIGESGTQEFKVKVYDQPANGTTIIKNTATIGSKETEPVSAHCETKVVTLGPQPVPPGPPPPPPRRLP